MPMDCADRSIGEVINNESPFKVPRYQRAYAWEDSHLADFVGDIQRAVESGRDQSQMVPHYFGALVTVRAQEPDDEYRLVIDGQQRLTTVSLAFRALERELRELSSAIEGEDEELAQSARNQATELHARYLEDEQAAGAEMVKVSRLKLSEVDDEYFQKLMKYEVLPPQAGSDRDSHKRLHAAARFLEGSRRNGAVEGLICPTRYEEDEDSPAESSASDRLDRLIAIKNAIANRSSMVHIKTDNREQADRIFVTLNNRGAALADSDLLRTHTLTRTEDDKKLQAVVAKHWDEMLENDGSYIDKFLKHYYSSLTGKSAPNVNKWRRYLDDPLGPGSPPLREQTSKQVCSFVSKMHAEEKIYRKICDGEWPFEDAEADLWDRRQVEGIVTGRGLSHTAALPLLLAGVKLGEREFSELLQLVGRFAFRYKSICNGNISRPQKLYWEAGQKIRSGMVSLDELKTQLQFELDRSAGDEVFKASMNEKMVYGGGVAHTGNIRYFFSALNDYWAGLIAEAVLTPAKDAPPDWAQLDIEHIYPNAPAPPDWDVDAAMGDRADFVENLTLWALGDNRSTQNASFDTKKDSVNAKGEAVGYKHSGLAVTRDLDSTYSDWSLNEMEDRRGRLVKFALRVFRADPR